MDNSVAALPPLLIAWFESNARDLPWRRSTDPYAIWISEIMLQQTQVKTVIPYWIRWMHEFPDIHSLAKANLDRVLKLWEGLGYYTRARHLHRAAQLIALERKGRFPVTHSDVLKLPGIGRYTAGAICSIAFNQPTPLLDGNVTRVLARLYGLKQNVRASSAQSRLWSIAEKLVVNAASLSIEWSCSKLNQSLMELGATICTPLNPSCSCCPIRVHCHANNKQCVQRLPNLGRKPPPTHRHFAAIAFHSRGRWFVRQRPSNVVNAHLWEFPNFEVQHKSDFARGFEALGINAAKPAPLCTINHSITRYRIRLDAFIVQLQKSTAAKSHSGKWHRLDELDQLAFPSAHRKIVERLKKING